MALAAWPLQQGPCSMAAASWPGESSSSGLAAATTMPLATLAAAVGHGDDSDLASLADLAGACSNSISINPYSPCAGSDNNEGCPGLADALTSSSDLEGEDAPALGVRFRALETHSGTLSFNCRQPESAKEVTTMLKWLVDVHFGSPGPTKVRSAPPPFSSGIRTSPPPFGAMPTSSFTASYSAP